MPDPGDGEYATHDQAVYSPHRKDPVLLFRLPREAHGMPDSDFARRAPFPRNRRIKFWQRMEIPDRNPEQRKMVTRKMLPTSTTTGREVGRRSVF